MVHCSSQSTLCLTFRLIFATEIWEHSWLLVTSKNSEGGEGKSLCYFLDPVSQQAKLDKIVVAFSTMSSYVAVVMLHGFLQDQTWIKETIKSSCMYS